MCDSTLKCYLKNQILNFCYIEPAHRLQGEDGREKIEMKRKEKKEIGQRGSLFFWPAKRPWQAKSHFLSKSCEHTTYGCLQKIKKDVKIKNCKINFYKKINTKNSVKIVDISLQINVQTLELKVLLKTIQFFQLRSALQSKRRLGYLSKWRLFGPMRNRSVWNSLCNVNV